VSASHNRRSIRLPGYDYTQPGAYFVTLVTCQREPLLAQIAAGEVHLTDIGLIAQEEWFRAAQLRPTIRLEPDEFVVMPNHVHGIIWIVAESDGPRLIPVGAQRRCAPTHPTNPNPQVKPDSLGAIVRAYKSAVTYRANLVNDIRGVPLWQRNYYEHILRSDADLDRVRAYIRSNPYQWDRDNENPAFSEKNL
jgi:REP element-mobilizing transposase RayT